MIQSLRTAHRLVFFAWTIVLPAVLVSGLMVRHREPKMAGQSSQEPMSQETVVSSGVIAGTGATVHVSAIVGKTETGGNYLRFVMDKPLVAPDVLVYRTQSQLQSTLPQNARLLGELRTSAKYELDESCSGGGFVHLYSFGEQKVLVTLALDGIP